MASTQSPSREIPAPRNIAANQDRDYDIDNNIHNYGSPFPSPTSLYSPILACSFHQHQHRPTAKTDAYHHHHHNNNISNSNAIARKPPLKPLKPKPNLASKRSFHSSKSSLSFSRTSKNWKQGYLERRDEGMDSSFLQYCTTCEKQIFVPDSSILYCSESCRDKDSQKPISFMSSPVETRLCTTPTHAVLPPRFSPREPVSIMPAKQHGFKPEVDPTEWKPKGIHRTTAFEYLSQFRRSTTPSCAQGVDQDKPAVKMAVVLPSTDTSCGLPTPSLTPASTSSSSLSSSVTQYEYDFTTRPLTPRHNPLMQSAARSVELVTPHANTGFAETTAFSVPMVQEVKNGYEKEEFCGLGTEEKSVQLDGGMDEVFGGSKK